VHRQIPWFEREFPTGVDPRLAAETIARLHGAPARFAALASGLPPERLMRRVEGAWSIQENVGHLADLDRILFTPRLDQFEAGAGTLLAADVTNRTTDEAGHNERRFEDVLASFAAARAEIVRRLDATPPEAFARTALHERLGVRMQLIDLCVFFAEHDDSHAARVRELMALTT